MLDDPKYKNKIEYHLRQNNGHKATKCPHSIHPPVQPAKRIHRSLDPDEVGTISNEENSSDDESSCSGSSFVLVHQFEDEDIAEEDDDDELDDTQISTSSPKYISADAPIQSNDFVFSREQSTNYFAAENGVAHITHLAMTKGLTNEVMQYKNMSSDDVAKFFLLVQTVWSSPKKQKRELAIIFKHFQEASSSRLNSIVEFDLGGSMDKDWVPLLEKQNACLPPVPFLPRPISQICELRNLVWDGKWAFLNLLPHPEPCIPSGGNVVYIPVIDSIAHLLR